ncbi:MAG TPA: hypothetical protein VKX28_25005 [Xanthobacteraceae bacterium]|nr:hypothetical protein [Xanthobacteraceae bacterium]
MSARFITQAIAALLLVALGATWISPAIAEPLTTVDLSSPAIRCVFSTSPHCNLDGTTTAGAIAIPGITGTAVLHTLTFPAFADSDAAGTYGYEYRFDLSQATAGPTKACIARLTVETGPIRKLPYTGRHETLFDVFVQNTHVAGMVGVASAERSGKSVTFTFAKPICPGAGADKGETSYFFGFAAAAKPREITAKVELDSGVTLDVAARAPAP